MPHKATERERVKERRREWNEKYTRMKEERHTDRKREENQRMEGKTLTQLGDPGIINKTLFLDMTVV